MTVGSISKDKFRKTLFSLGFVENRSRDHIYFEYYYKEKKILDTKISHSSNKDISKRLLGYILREQIYLTRQEFESAVNGNLSSEDYISILKIKGIIS